MENAAVSERSTEATLAPADFQFALPPELIAQVPAERRDQARLMVLNRGRGVPLHSHVHALPEHLRPGDILVVNDTRVVPARIFGRTHSGGAVELLLTRRIADTDLASVAVNGPPAPRSRLPSTGSHSPTLAASRKGERGPSMELAATQNTWLCLGKPARRLRAGAALTLPGNEHATVTAVHGDGFYSVGFDPSLDIAAWLARHGEIPLPPYIGRPDGPLALDRSRYQTVFAANDGAVAAPTAGLHFTAALFAVLHDRGVEVARLTLHVGPGTFLPVRTDDLCQHVMEPEWSDIPVETAAAIRRVKAGGGRVIAVGTTTTRALESAAADGGVRSGAGWADRFIVPGYQFRVIDALLTNFHLPGSTLLLLVSAFAGRERILRAYAEAIRRQYRFYSYGDAMLIQ
jgi:S-adenosylmethionine:tRNA ribosyltransferase-isomerase